MKAHKSTKEKNMDLKHFVTFFYKSANGLFEDTHSLKSDKLTSLRIPARALGFKLFDRPNDDIILNGEKVVSKHTDINEKLYYIGRLISIDKIKKKFGEDSDAYNEITRNNFYGAVLTREKRAYATPLKRERAYTPTN